MDTKRIRWEDDGRNGFAGWAGTLDRHLFTVWQSPRDGDAYIVGEWVLATRLPAPASWRTPHGFDPDELKAEAERWLEEFVSSLGAVFPEPSWHDGWSWASRDGDGNLILRYEESGGLYKVLPVEEC